VVIHGSIGVLEVVIGVDGAPVRLDFVCFEGSDSEHETHSSASTAVEDQWAAVMLNACASLENVEAEAGTSLMNNLSGTEQRGNQKLGCAMTTGSTK
jgi:hypothetical protein